MLSAVISSFWFLIFQQKEKGVPLPKFGEWDVNDPASAEGFTVIFNKARTEKKTGGRPDSPSKEDHTYKHEAVLGKPPSKKWFCCLRAES
ncbi:protein NOI4 isoform X2 [Pyrus x bretschneideri]|uniref:protein NOI4 isoform X2 n=1 Tax=Pyrus x bretschneideri TaxID=225117 RepID=UPI002030FFD3|nr:protein NOI4 isoform X2 [Pyrus x bretschneideri]